MNAAERLAALEVEAERIKERLDHLNRYLTGHPDAWVEIINRLPAEVAEIVIDKALSEARQQALALATVTKTLATLQAEVAPARTGPDPADEVKRKREEKLAAARAAQS